MTSKPTWRSALLACLIASHFTLAQAASPADLFKAADSGNAAQVNALISQGVPVDSADPDGWTPLMVAAAAGKLSAVQALVKAGADVNAKTRRGETPLVAAALSGNVPIVKLLLSEGADKTAVTAQGLTAADVAKKAKHANLLKLLVVSGSQATVPAVTAQPKGVDPKNISAKSEQAAQAFKAGDYARAVQLFREVTVLNPEDALVWHFLGQALDKTGDKQAAIAAYLRSMDITPTGDLALRNQKFLAQLPIRDCADCPEMMVIPAGRFTMGSPGGESGRFDDEGPLHEVNVPRFELSKYEVTVGEFRAFARATGYRTDAEKDAGNNTGCRAWSDSDDKKDWRSGLYWDSPGFPQTERHPVVCVSWNDAKAYVDWLSQKSGKKYRLPSEAEWEYAARAGTTSARPWGDNPDDACRFANVTDQSKSPSGKIWTKRHECNDGYWYPAPVGSYLPNAFGLNDTIGNAWEWVEDCYHNHNSYGGAPTDGSAWTTGCIEDRRVLRGGSWNIVPQVARSANRNRSTPANRSFSFGFRPARMLP